MIRRALLVSALTAVGGFALAGIAQASFHVMMVKEVRGDSGGQGFGFIELQMYDPNQNFVSGHTITIWDDDGVPSPLVTLPLMGPNPPNGQNQRTILIGDSGVVGADFTVDLTPYLDATMMGNVTPAGAVCFDAIPVDCVSWGGGAFTGAANLPDLTMPFGSPLGNGSTALRRSIAGGSCVTALDAADDTNNAAADFSSVAPGPTPNAAAPSETLCSPLLTTPTAPTTPSAPVKPGPSTRKKCKKPKKKAKLGAAAACKKKRKK